MSELYRLQKGMMSWLIKKQDMIKADIVSTEDVSSEVRLSVYGDGYGYRLIDALSENYPAVHTLLGDDDFFEMAYAYMDAFPSRHFSLRFFGSELETFLKDYLKDLPVIAEMAKFEWVLRNSFDAKNQLSMTMDALQDVPLENWGDMKFDFKDSVSRLSLEWNTPQLWSAIDSESDPIAPEKLEYPYSWIVWRKDLLNYYRSLDVDEAWALDRAMNEATFQDLCVGVCEWVDEEHAPARVAGFLTQWIEDQLLVGVA